MEELTFSEQKYPMITLMIPLYNEENYLPGLMASLHEQTYPLEQTQIIVVDGHSSDRTLELLQEYSAQFPHFLILENPQKIVPISLNKAIAKAEGQYLVRWDAHTQYAPDYIAQCVAYLEKTRADNVGGPIRLIGDTPVRQAIKLATTCVFGVGNSQFHYEDHEGDVDTVYLGAFRKDVFEKVGAFDEELVRNQDDELNYRIILGGGRIYLTPEIRSSYFPRDSLKKLWKQYYQYGFWKVRVIQKHGRPASLRHWVPGLFVLSLLGGSILSLLSPWGLLLLGPSLGLYLLALSFFTLKTSVAQKFKSPWLLATVFVILHLSYGSGFLKGWLHFHLFHRPTPSQGGA